MKVVFEVLAELVARVQEKGRAVFIADGIVMVLRADGADGGFVLEEREYGTICLAYSLDDALECVMDHADGGEVKFLDE